MRVAVPLFGEEVAPRFCFAERMLVADLVDGNLEQSKVVPLGLPNWSDRLVLLGEMGIDVLLCGGFPRRYEPFANSVGIKVIAGLAGPADALLRAFAHGEIERWLVVPSGRSGPGRGRGRGLARRGRRGGMFPHGGRR